jgi:K+-transporting ATPase KdpF subunit
MKATILILTTAATGDNGSAGYVAGATIAILILGYLFYSLIKPEKF